MRQLLILLLVFGLFACDRQSNDTEVLQNRIDSLEVKLADTYIPGLGDFMSSMQIHQSKLWFAGKYENWDLADFEVHEIMEAIEDIQKFLSDRKESQMVGMLIPPLDSIEDAIHRKDPASFMSSYNLLTNTCNLCHQQVEFEFVVVKTPESSPFGNQDFKPIN